MIVTCDSVGNCEYYAHALSLFPPAREKEREIVASAFPKDVVPGASRAAHGARRAARCRLARTGGVLRLS